MSSPFQKAFSSKSPLGKVPCKLPYPGKEVAAGKHGGKMTKEMSKANAEAKLKKRPLLADMKAAKNLYNSRRPEYLDIADLVVDVTNKSNPQFISKISYASI